MRTTIKWRLVHIYVDLILNLYQHGIESLWKKRGWTGSMKHPVYRRVNAERNLRKNPPKVV